MIFLSLSLLIYSLKSVTTAQADPGDYSGRDIRKSFNTLPVIPVDTIVNEDDFEGDIRAIQAFGIGIREGNLYFGILYNNNSIGLHKAPAESEDVLEW